MRWVKLTFDTAVAARCLLRIARFSSRVRTGTLRMEVAVGTVRLASMFSTMRIAPPRIGVAMSPGRMAGTISDFEPRVAGVAAGDRTSVVVRAGASAVARLRGRRAAAAGGGAATPSRRSKYCPHDGSTDARSRRYSSSRSSAKT